MRISASHLLLWVHEGLPRRVLATTLCCALLTACTIGDPSEPTVSSSPSSLSTDANPCHPEPPDPNLGDDRQQGEGRDGAPEVEPKRNQPISITVSAAGDLLMHTPVSRAAMEHGNGDYDYVALMSEIQPILEGSDLSLCHIEGPMNPRNENLNVAYEMVFNFPKEIARDAKRLGYDGCEFASNHTVDQGLQGLADTEQVIRDAGLGYAGPTMNEERAGQPELYEVGGAKVAHLAFTYTYPNSGTPTETIPEGAPWLEKHLWPVLGADGILEQAKQAKVDGADFVITSKHVIYGRGNSISNQAPVVLPDFRPDVQDGMVATFTLNRDDDGVITTEMAYTPTFVEIPGHTIRRVTPESNPESFDRTAGTVNALGGCDAVIEP